MTPKETLERMGGGYLAAAHIIRASGAILQIGIVTDKTRAFEAQQDYAHGVLIKHALNRMSWRTLATRRIDFHHNPSKYGTESESSRHAIY